MHMQVERLGLHVYLAKLRLSLIEGVCHSNATIADSAVAAIVWLADYAGLGPAMPGTSPCGVSHTRCMHLCCTLCDPSCMHCAMSWLSVADAAAVVAGVVGV